MLEIAAARSGKACRFLNFFNTNLSGSTNIHLIRIRGKQIGEEPDLHVDTQSKLMTVYTLYTTHCSFKAAMYFFPTRV